MIFIINAGIISFFHALLIPLLIVFCISKSSPETGKKIFKYSYSTALILYGLSLGLDIVCSNCAHSDLIKEVKSILLQTIIGVPVFLAVSTLFQKVKYQFIKTFILVPASFVAVVMLFIALVMGLPKPLKEPMKKNYELHQKEIADLKQYFESITDNGSIKVDIEFEGKNIRRLCTKPHDDDKLYGCLYDLDSKEYIIDAVSKVGWNEKIIKTLRNKLKAANCVSIDNIKEPLQIGFKRSGMGMYFYRVFDDNLTQKEIEEFNDRCTYLYYRDNIVLEYGGAAFGSAQCFEDFKR